MKIADNKEKTMKIEAKLTKYAQKHRTMKIQLDSCLVQEVSKSTLIWLHKRNLIKKTKFFTAQFHLHSYTLNSLT